MRRVSIALKIEEWGSPFTSLDTNGSSLYARIPFIGPSAGPYGTGQRMKIAHTRAMVHAALDGSLANVPSAPDSVFGLMTPKSCPDVPSEVLDPRSTWKDKRGYDLQAQKLAAMFRENFKQFEADVKDEIREAAPRTLQHS
jgi:phosphoenolpyruvate carboxykinase (ATP)